MTDEQLQNIVSGKYVVTTKKIKVIERALGKKVLDPEDREVLTLYLNSQTQRSSIRSMKNAILQKIGYTTKNDWGSTVSRDEVEAIYNYIMGQSND